MKLIHVSSKYWTLRRQTKQSQPSLEPQANLKWVVEAALGEEGGSRENEAQSETKWQCTVTITPDIYDIIFD